ncbi:hypothetical protein BP6252_10324 [Coleophoma cylindrospora]|uniref:Zn(2)-C6 fungal-type domain-containing protein n=1 Tax=Coleophoma cylindrospora TaxID=1849047 RepID=A0A3D8QS71_9HELO|nr:hypothetical protein BP6252_10324 [Coleophoma cylindrospora]
MIRTRCQACTRRRIKCEGGAPCIYCVKKGFPCVPQAAKNDSSIAFVHKSAPKHRASTLATIPAKVSETQPSLFLRHFFSTFLPRNDFAVGSLDQNTIVCGFQYSPSLYHALCALGALDISKKATKGREAKIAALTSYRASITSVQVDISHSGSKSQDSNLWTTLFLGLFELMSDISGEGWVKHILYGTSKILQTRKPEAYLRGSGRSFFLTARVFEICRSLIYNDISFLFEDQWVSLMGRIWEEDIADWHPKEKLFDLMLSCSELSSEVSSAIEHDESPTELALYEFAARGISLRSDIEMWYLGFQQWTGLETDSRSTLAKLYYHAISIFLSGIFDYRHEFNCISSPALPFGIIQSHVGSILSGADSALRTTSLSGLLYFFPLRVAGARAVLQEQKFSIISILDHLSLDFIVAGAFKEDLAALWEMGTLS